MHVRHFIYKQGAQENKPGATEQSRPLTQGGRDRFHYTLGLGCRTGVSWIKLRVTLELDRP